jgi:hypothetical protein
MTKGKARAFAACGLAPLFHGRGPSVDAIRRWQQAQPLLDEEREHARVGRGAEKSDPAR